MKNQSENQTQNESENHAEQQAAAQYATIVRMLAAVDCDYDRLEELKDEYEELTEAVREAESAYNAAKDTQEGEIEALESYQQALIALTNCSKDLAELEEEAGDYENEDEAREAIQDHPLEINVRSDWTTPGEALEASEFMILLCTGGPAVRIVGDLCNGEPTRAWMEYQDWGTGWQQWFGARSATLCEYARHFYFGE